MNAHQSIKTPVSLWILVARTDVPYMLQTIPHLIRSCNYPFVEKVLAMDTAPLIGDKRYRYDTGSQQQLEEACQTLISQGIMDRVAEIDYNPQLIKTIYEKYFGTQQAAQMINHTHNWKGSTVYASLYCIEAAASNYYLHFDADMLLYQDQGNDWITEGIKVMDAVPNIATIRPLCGPPDPEGKVIHYPKFYQDGGNFYGYKSFSMRAYLVERKRFAQLSPIPLSWKFNPLWSRYLPKLFQPLAGKIERKLRNTKSPVQGAIDSLEPMTGKRLLETDFMRANLSSRKAWTIHPPQHNSTFIKILPDLINSIEKGEYPLKQVGYYDLVLQAWEEFLEKKNSVTS